MFGVRLIHECGLYTSLYGMLNNRRTCELAVHYNSSQHDISQIDFIIIEQITSFQNPLHLDQLLLTREAY